VDTPGSGTDGSLSHIVWVEPQWELLLTCVGDVMYSVFNQFQQCRGGGTVVGVELKLMRS